MEECYCCPECEKLFSCPDDFFEHVTLCDGDQIIVEDETDEEE